jgi:formate hydrogenlyase transcriptional activator
MGMTGQTIPDSPPTVAADELMALRSIVEGTAAATGEEFFHALVQHLAKAMEIEYALVAEFLGNMKARTLGWWTPKGIDENYEWDLMGSPCEDVVQGKLCHHPVGVAEKFPRDEGLAHLNIESYMGVPLCAPNGDVLGHLAVLGTHAMPAEPRKLFIFKIFAARATAELLRLRAETLLSDSERKFRDLYEEAPIAYIYEKLDSQFVAANRAAIKLLGLKPEEVRGTFGTSLLAPTPDTQQKIRDALSAMKQEKKEFSCLELELRRKSDGKPIWVQWWSKPEPDGLHTRTMLVDITERVLMEQERARLEAQNLYLQEEIKSVHNFEEIIGQSPPLLAVLDKVRRVAPTDASVLITGETGTGKELFARAIHSNSARRGKPLIKVNCAALPTGLVESELFGHEKGAFSGAITRRIGRFELANGGTIFLDEIGEVPPEVQVKLLRVLQEKEFERVGGSAPIKADVRIIAATNRDLQKAAGDGTFRRDLFYRLNVFPISLPPLRERLEDLPLLVNFLVSKFAARVGRHIDAVGQKTMERIKRYHWPGNIRELENILERAVILSVSSTLEIDAEVFASATSGGKETPVLLMDLEAVEKNHILAVLKRTNWVIEGENGAANILNLHPNTLRSRLKKLGISRETHEPS